MIKLVAGDNRLIILFYLIFIISVDRLVLTREERKRLVLDLYNQGKGTREIAKELNVI